MGRAKHKKKRVLASGASVRDKDGVRRIGSVRRMNSQRSALCVVSQSRDAPFEKAVADSCAERIRALLTAIDPTWADEGSNVKLTKGWQCTCEGCDEADIQRQ